MFVCRILSFSAFSAFVLLAAACVRTRTELIAPLDAPAVVAADSARAAATEPAASRRAAEGPSALAMARVDFHVAPHVVLHVTELRGEAVATDSNQPISFDDRRSFLIRVANADVGITLDDLGHLLNQYVFAYPGAPLFDLQLSSVGDRLRLRGKLRKGGDVPFEILASVSTTPDGKVRIHPSSIRVARVPAGGLLKLVGLRLDRIMNLNESRGADVVGNDILFDVGQMTPPPQIHGHLSRVHVVGNELRLGFGDTASALNVAALPEPATNYLYFRGGTIRIGKLFMVHADLEIIDAAPADPLDFDIDQYARQLVAGYVKNTVAGGLVVHMPDLHRLLAGP